MSKLKNSIIAMACFYLLSGCAVTPDMGTGAAMEARTQGQTTSTGSANATIKPDTAKPLPTAMQTPPVAPKATSTPVPKNTPLQPAAAAKGIKLDFDLLDKLDNTKYGWGLSLNKEHKTPGIPANTKKLLDKYNGIFVGDTSKKSIYLTFDEGYENGYTPKILDTLKANDVKAIFFVTGQYLKQEPGLVKRMLNEGHLVGNHTVNHPSLPTVGNAVLESEVLSLEKEFEALSGKGMKYLRPPMGEYSEKTLAALKGLGYKTVFWSFAYLDYDVNNQKGADYAYNMVMPNLHNGAVILLHAVSKDNTEALDRIIKDIRAQGYSINPFDL